MTKLYQITNEQIRKDFTELAARMGMPKKDIQEYVELWFRKFQELTKNDNNLKTNFLFELDKDCGQIWKTIYRFES